ncbi:MAG: ATP synthase epsilon chain [Syntrophorhabdaceae bacterium PtaU1.Bin034]|nr:MAG: ATP synthase epsilon chain [Syntrophorhabdaceae bacterium PtaU1.Bin034]
MTKVERLFLEIVTPERVMVTQEVDIVEAPGTSGEFGVLPGHCTYLTTLEAGEVRFSVDGTTRFMATSGGFAEVVDNKMTLLLDTAEFSEEINIERAQRARERAESALKDLSSENQEVQAFEAALSRAIARISTASKRTSD